MERYRLDTMDGLVHIISVLYRDEESLECEAFYSDGTRTVQIHQNFNRCLFELLLRLGIVQPLQERKEAEEALSLF